jgi:hypothetical protein
MKKVLWKLAICFTVASWLALAADDIAIIPEWNASWNTTVAAEKVKEVSSWWNVWKIYRKIVDEENMSVWDQLASGIMNWDTILNYSVYIAKFLWEIALLAWAVAIIFLWYKRITKNIFWDTPKWILLVIIWLLIIIFAYAIIKLIWSAFIS